MAKRFTPEEAIQAARDAGLNTTDLEQQAAERRTGGSLGEKVDALGAKLEERVPPPPASREQQEQAFAGELLEAVNASTSKWHSLGGHGG